MLTYAEELPEQQLTDHVTDEDDNTCGISVISSHNLNAQASQLSLDSNAALVALLRRT